MWVQSRSVNSSLLTSLVCFFSNVTSQRFLSFFSLHAIKYLHIWMSDFPSAGSNRLWYVLELFCIAASVSFQQPPELWSDPGAAWQEERTWDPWEVPYNTEPAEALGGPSVHGSFRTCFLPVECFQRQISKGNKYWVMTTECIFGTC